MIFKTESGRVGYRKKYRVVGRVRVPVGHCLRHVVIIRLSSRCKTQLVFTGEKPEEAKISIFQVRLGDDVSNVEKLNFLTLNC